MNRNLLAVARDRFPRFTTLRGQKGGFMYGIRVPATTLATLEDYSFGPSPLVARIIRNV